MMGGKSARPRARKQPRDSEVHAYDFIKRTLQLLGWDVRNPERVGTGRVWTQNECLYDPEIRRCLVLDKPENIVKVTERALWIIEAKPTHRQIDIAVAEAQEYAAKFRDSERYEACFVSGVAGNDIDSYLVRTLFQKGKRFVPVSLNGVPATGLLTRAQLAQILETDNPDISEAQIDERLFISRAEKINEILHLGAVNPHRRAGVMAAMLLAMLSDTPPNMEERRPTVLIGDINARVEAILRDQGKPEFYEYIKIALPSTPDNHAKLRKALVDTLQELNSLNIRSAMNSGADWLGAFYEVFLKYASWAQDLGITLTPRHLTRFVAYVMDVGVNDLIYDPTCGTAGFLVAAFDHVKQNATPRQLSHFKRHAVFGIEQDDGVAALAVVNMIFRGDGKNNIRNGNGLVQCLAPRNENGQRTAAYVDRPSPSPPITKIMMNPPFALKRSDEKEYRFIDHAVKSVQDGGLVFSVLPYGAMVRPGGYKNWRRNSLLAHNTLLAVVTFPSDVFYPIGVTTVGVFIKKGIPHPSEQPVLWVRALTDGFVKSKGKRLPSTRTTNDLAEVRDLLRAFIHNPALTVPNVHQFTKAASIDLDDPQLELVPEAYLDQAEPQHDRVITGIEGSCRYLLAYLVKFNLVDLHGEFAPTSRPRAIRAPTWQRFSVTDIFALGRGHFHSIANLDHGEDELPTISRVSTDNGLVGFYEKPGTASIWPPWTITVSSVTGDAFIQPTPFIATDNVVICVPSEEYGSLRLTTLFFIQFMLNKVAILIREAVLQN